MLLIGRGLIQKVREVQELSGKDGRSRKQTPQGNGCGIREKMEEKQCSVLRVQSE